MEDDATTLNNNIKENAKQLELMFAAEEFPDIEIYKPTLKMKDANKSDSNEEWKQKSARSMKKDSKPSKAKTKSQKVLPHRDERPVSAASRETTSARSYSQVTSRNPLVSRKELTAPKSKMQDMKELIEKMYKENRKLYNWCWMAKRPLQSHKTNLAARMRLFRMSIEQRQDRYNDSRSM